MTYPTLYSLQHCPYAMRARIGLLAAQQTIALRAISLKNKPTEMLAASPKGEVPVLVLEDKSVIDESIDIMIWALHQSDPDDLLCSNDPSAFEEMRELITRNDNDFIPALEKYKYAKRYHEPSENNDRQQCEAFIAQLEQRLNEHRFIMGKKLSLADYALLPFIRQFSRVDRKWFVQTPPYPNLRNWLSYHLQSTIYSKAMFKYPLWLDEHQEFIFSNE